MKESRLICYEIRLEEDMKVVNNASFAVLVFGWHTSKGYGDDVLVAPGETKEVNGPYFGEMGGGACYVALQGEVACHEAPDNDKGMKIGLGLPIFCAEGDCGFTIRHHSEQPESCVTEWRQSVNHLSA